MGKEKIETLTYKKASQHNSFEIKNKKPPQTNIAEAFCFKKKYQDFGSR